MLHLNFNQSFSFTVNVGNYDADSIILALEDAKFQVQHNINVNAPKTVDITIICKKGINDAVKAANIVNLS